MSFHAYIFLETDSSFYTQSLAKQKKARAELLVFFKKYPTLLVASYVLTPFKQQTRIMLWLSAKGVEEIQDFSNALLHTELGVYLRVSYSYLGMTRPSTYNSRGSSERAISTSSKRLPYLIVYPFTKTTAWYALPFEDRKKMMIEHMITAHKSEAIDQLLLYAYGIDDHEFILSYETSNLEAFQTLLVNLRSTKAREYTKSDTPIFLCNNRSLKEVVAFL